MGGSPEGSHEVAPRAGMYFPLRSANLVERAASFIDLKELRVGTDPTMEALVMKKGSWQVIFEVPRYHSTVDAFYTLAHQTREGDQVQDGKKTIVTISALSCMPTPLVFIRPGVERVSAEEVTPDGLHHVIIDPQRQEQIAHFIFTVAAHHRHAA